MMVGMATVAVFPSVLGVGDGVADAVARLEAAGHAVRVVDPLEGRSFDAYEPAMAHTEELGFPVLMERALEGVADLPDDLVVAGFSNGAAMAELVAVRRPVGGAVLLAGAVRLEWLGAEGWPAGVPAQVHAATDDPFDDGELAGFMADVAGADARIERFDYELTGHLFMDPSLPREHDAPATELLWQRVLAFLADR